MTGGGISVLFDENDRPAWRLEPARAPDIVCAGVPTDSVLGLLCALGTLRTLDRAWPDKNVRMAWRRVGAAWRPCLWVSAETLSGVTAEKQRRVVQALCDYLTKADAPWWSFADDPKMPCSVFRKKTEEVNGTTSHRSRESADWLAAYGCEVFAPSPEEDILDSDLNMMRRASQQLFIKSMRELAAPDCTTPDHIHRALFCQWLYADRKPYLRLDYRDDRSLAAYRAYDPQDRDGRKAMSPIVTERGANRLAAEAIPLIPTSPSTRGIATVGFTRCERTTFIRFPLWESPATITSVACLLGHPELVTAVPDKVSLRSLGVTGILQAARNQSDKGGRSFRPVEQIW
jgi:hypothetical protein